MPPPDRGAYARAVLLQRSRALRSESTDAESLLWRLLRSRQLAGAKFRRQQPFGPFILDLYCHERKLVIEVDGGQHTLPAEAAKDAQRSDYLESRGLRVLRFTNLEVLQEPDAVVQSIWEVVEVPSP